MKRGKLYIKDYHLTLKFKNSNSSIPPLQQGSTASGRKVDDSDNRPKIGADTYTLAW